MLCGSTEPADDSGPFRLSSAAGEGLVADGVGRELPGVVTGPGPPGVGRGDVGCGEPAAEGAGLETVLLAGPITPDDRLKRVCERAKGFVYGVNLLGVTGERAELASSSTVLAKRLKATTDLPVVMGFGIATPDQAAAAAAHVPVREIVHERGDRAAGGRGVVRVELVPYGGDRVLEP